MDNQPEIIVFDTLFDTISEAVIVINKHHQIKIVNASAEKMFGYEQGELVNQSIKVIIPEKYQQPLLAYFDEFQNSEENNQIEIKQNSQAVRKNKTYFPVESKLTSFELYGEKFIMGIIIDITFQKSQELEIQRRIEAENKAQTALKKEQELNELKTKFLSLVSHQFKTPLTGISISSMLLGKYKLTDQQEKREKHISIINNKVHYLNKIISDFLSVEKLDKGEVKYNITTFNIKNIVDNTINEVTSILKSGQHIVCENNIDDILITHDEKIIELTLSNLLSNAVKYSHENNKISIEIEQNSTETIIKVKDKGFGIPENEKKNIFNRYFRAENVLLIEGTGIGLNIIKDHLTNLGGIITFKSKQNVGTTFIVTIPNKFN